MNPNNEKFKLILLCMTIFLLLILSCSNKKENLNPTLKGNLLKLQGKWQSDDDPSSIIEIKNNQFISYYENDTMISETIEFINNAEDRKSDSDGEYFIVKGEFDAMIYYLIEVSKSKLIYSFVGRGNSLRYTKIN